MSVNIAHMLENRAFEPLIRTVADIAARMGIEAYPIGGIIRDMLLGRATMDIDFVTIGPGTGIALAEMVAEELSGATAHVYPNFGTAAVRVPHGEAEGETVLEFVAARKESYREDSRKPLVEEGTLDDDQRRRDFTINAMAIHISPDRFGELIDPFGGVADLDRGILKTPLEPIRAFDDDPLRIVRAARFSAQLGFQIDDSTFGAMRHRAERIAIVSAERIIDELQKIMSAAVPSIGFRILHDCRVLDLIFPELTLLQGVETIDGQKHKDNFYHTLEVLDNLAALTSETPCEKTRWLRWAALLHDIGKPDSKRFTPGFGWSFHSHEELGARMVPKLFRRLRLPMDERMKYVQKMIRLHHRPVSLVDDQVTDSAVRRLLFDAGDDIDNLMLLVRADITSKNPRRVRKYLRAFDIVEKKMVEVEEKDRLRQFQPPLDGIEIMETLGLKPGRVVGDLKEAIREAILEGKIPNEHDAASEYLIEIKDEILARTNL